MASSSISFPQHRKPFPIERRPKLLKDFLNDNSNSCSSSGFKSFPRHQPLNPKIHSKPTNPKTASPFQALINAVKKSNPFTAVKKSPSFLPRSLSRRLSKRGSSKSTKAKKEVKLISVRVKDILRWTSFRDVAEEKSPPSDFSPSPNHYTITTTGSTNDSSSDSNINSSSFSWCESDFTAEFLPSRCSNSDEKEFIQMSENILPCNVGVDYVDATIDTARDPQGEFELYDEDEQQSPVSVFDFQFRENEEPFSSFDQSLANVERTRQQLIEKIKEFESLSNLERSAEFDDKEEEINSNNYEDIEEEEECEMVEERARELLVYVKATSSTKISRVEEELLFGFFRDELKSLESIEYSKYGGYNWDMVTLAKAWMSGECNVFDHGLEHYNREAYISDMNKVGNWSKFEVEQEDLALEIGDGMLGQLIDELLIDILVK